MRLVISIGISLLIAFSLFYRIPKIGDYGYWIDEKATVQRALGVENIELDNAVFTSKDYFESASLLTGLKVTIRDNTGNNILYNSMTHIWVKLWGPEEFSLRLLSVVFWVLILLTSFLLVRVFFPEHYWLPWLVLTMLAINPMLIKYGEEARAYPLATLFSLFSTYVLLLYLKAKIPRKRFFIIYAVCLLAAFFSHYLALFVAFAHIVFLVVFQLQFVKKNRIRLIVMYSTIAIIAFSWLLLLKNNHDDSISKHQNNYKEIASDPNNPQHGKLNKWLVETDADLLLAGTYSQITSMQGHRYYSTYRSASILYAFSQGALMKVLNLLGIEFTPRYEPLFTQKTWSYVGLLIVLLLFTYFFHQRRSTRDHVIVLLLLLFLTGPFISSMLAIIAEHGLSFTERYVTFYIPYVSILLSLILYRLWFANFGSFRLIVRSLIIVLVLIQTVSAREVFVRENFRKPSPYAQTADYLVEHYQAGDTVKYATWDDAFNTNIYLEQHPEIVQMVDTALAPLFIYYSRKGETEVITELEGKVY